FWGGDRKLPDYVAYVQQQLETAGPEILRYVGLANQRGRVVGSIKRYGLLLRDEHGVVHRTLGIGAVFTAPEARGTGVASTLLRAVLDEARNLGYGAALLYSDIDPDFYARLGFVPLPARDWAIRVADLPTEGALDVRRARETDLDAILAWHEAAWRARTPAFLHLARSRALHRFFCFRSRIPAVWILRHRGRDAGYLIASPDDPLRDLPDPRPPRLYWFDEAGAPGVPRDRIWATVRALATKARAHEVGGWLGPEGAPDGASLSKRPASFPMIAPLSPAIRVRPRRAWLDSFQHF